MFLYFTYETNLTSKNQLKKLIQLELQIHKNFIMESTKQMIIWFISGFLDLTVC